VYFAEDTIQARRTTAVHVRRSAIASLGLRHIFSKAASKLAYSPLKKRHIFAGRYMSSTLFE